jgi:hypothetical protein
MKVDPGFMADLQKARDTAVHGLVDGLGPYSALVEQLQQAAGREFNWVRDVTVSNSTWGNRYLRIFDPRAGVHALGGGIGQGLAMGIGAAIGAAVTQSGKKTFTLAGDGGFILNLGELATAVQEQADMVIVLMNDKGYGVIKNIQDAQYGGRRHYVDLHTPDYAGTVLGAEAASPARATWPRWPGAGRGAVAEGPVPAGDRHAGHRQLQDLRLAGPPVNNGPSRRAAAVVACRHRCHRLRSRACCTYR